MLNKIYRLFRNKKSGPDPIDISGRRFGMLTAVKFSHRQSRAYWLFQCDCGRKATVAKHHAKSGHTKSCGCDHWKAGNKHWRSRYKG